MTSRIISVVSGLTAVLTMLVFQLATGCSSEHSNINPSKQAGFAKIFFLAGERMLQRITVASIVVILISIAMLLIDRYLDNRVLKK